MPSECLLYFRDLTSREFFYIWTPTPPSTINPPACLITFLFNQPLATNLGVEFAGLTDWRGGSDFPNPTCAFTSDTTEQAQATGSSLANRSYPKQQSGYNEHSPGTKAVLGLCQVPHRTTKGEFLELLSARTKSKLLSSDFLKYNSQEINIHRLGVAYFMYSPALRISGNWCTIFWTLLIFTWSLMNIQRTSIRG